MGNATVFVAIGLAFLAALLGVLGGVEALANRVAREKGLYERLIGKELYRLFLDISPQEFFLLHLLFLIMAIVMSGIMIEDWTMGVIVGGVVMAVFLPMLGLVSSLSGQ